MPSRRSSAPICPGSLHRSASARMRRFSLAENCRRRAIATTSGCAGAEREAASALALRAPFNATSCSADCGSGFTTDFIGLAMNCILSLYSNWSKAGVASHIGTQGRRDGTVSFQGKRFEVPYELVGKTVLLVVDPHTGTVMGIESEAGEP